MACGSDQHFPAFYSSFSKNSVFISCSSLPSSELLSLGEQHAIASHFGSNCKLENCNFHLLLIGSNIEPECSTFLPAYLPTSFRYQSVDCLFTVFYTYFQSRLKNSGPIFELLCSAVDFHASLAKPLLYRPSIARKRLLRKRFRSYIAKKDITSVCTSNSVANHTQRPPEISHTFLNRLEHILNSNLAVDLYNIIDIMCDGSGHYHSSTSNFTLTS